MSKTRNTAKLYAKATKATSNEGKTLNKGSAARNAWKKYVKIQGEQLKGTKRVEPRPFVPHANNMAVLSFDQAGSIAYKDAPTLTSDDPKKFALTNQVAYYALLNTWLLQVRDLSSERAMIECGRCVLNNGLVATISVCDKIASALVAGTEYVIPDGFTWVRYISCDEMSDLLQILRFPKRFCPIGADLIQQRGIEKFYAINSVHHTTKFDNFCWWLEDAVGQHLASIFKNFSKELAKAFPRFSSGVCADAKVLCDKVKKLSTFDHYYLDRLYPIGNPEGCRPLRDQYVLKPVCVPKSYKAPRVIVEERSKEAFEFQRGLAAARQCLYKSKYVKYFDDRDQDRNRELCRLGSIDGSYATIDLTSASDSISYHLAKRVFPAAVMEYIDQWRAKSLMSPTGAIWVNEIFLTSGNPLCFIMEGCFFMSVALVATEFCSLYLEDKPLKPHIFGDDLIVDARVADVLCEMLAKLGCIPNLEKSFSGTRLYRESCGVEFYHGLPVETRYWPRRALGLRSFDPNELSSLVSLQHRLHSISWRASEFLIQLVLEMEPRMTSSLPGTECTDLWSDAPWFKRTNAPYKGTLPTVDAWYRRERHLTLVTKRFPVCYNADMDMVHYVEFLRNGSHNPDTPEGRLLSLLGCKLPSDYDDFGLNEAEWQYRTV